MGNTSSCSDRILPEIPNDNNNNNTSNSFQTNSQIEQETNTNDDGEHHVASPMMMMSAVTTAVATTASAAATASTTTTTTTTTTTDAALSTASNTDPSSIKKELIIESCGEDNHACKGFVEVGPLDTLADVRVLLHEEFDDDMLPTYCATATAKDGGGDGVNAAIDAVTDDFYFCVAGVRLSRKQERRKRAWDFRGQTVRILARKTHTTSSQSISGSCIHKKRPRETEEQQQQEEKKEQDHVEDEQYHREAAAEATAEKNESKKQRTLNVTRPNFRTNATDVALAADVDAAVVAAAAAAIEEYRTPSAVDGKRDGGASDMIVDTTTSTSTSLATAENKSNTQCALNVPLNDTTNASAAAATEYYKTPSAAVDGAPDGGASDMIVDATTSTSTRTNTNMDTRTIASLLIPKAPLSPGNNSAKDQAVNLDSNFKATETAKDPLPAAATAAPTMASNISNTTAAIASTATTSATTITTPMEEEEESDGDQSGLIADSAVEKDSSIVDSEDEKESSISGEGYQITPVATVQVEEDTPMPASTNDETASVEHIETEDHYSVNETDHELLEDDSLAVKQGNEKTTESTQNVTANAAASLSACMDVDHRKDPNTTTTTSHHRVRNNGTDDDIVVTGGTAATDTAETETVDTHKLHEQALAKSCLVLKDINALLQDNPLFCSQDRRQEWSQDIEEILAKAAPKTIIGVLGNTGVGKSSLLNALLDEAAVLPTSGSRGCTAAVVELRFNSDLKKEQQDTSTATGTETVPVYKGEVEFMTLAEWGHELRILVDECSTHEEKTIYARPPDDQRQPDAAAAWGKINSVYGSNTLERFHGRPKGLVYKILFEDRRVNTLLTPEPGSHKVYNSIHVEEGQVDPAQAKYLLQGFGKMNVRARRSKKKWAQAFRRKINDYVYRKGNGDLPQTWPLTRKVVLHGPWPVLSTGACLVDLPGVRDANAARAKVSEHYLQNCSQIWVVAPIKRAVDDGTAKELLGEQFKRRLLMDGQYGNVSFICTQTDDCEATETMRDHQDVAMKKPGRWEAMSQISDRLGSLDRELADLVQEEEDLKAEWEEAKQWEKESKEELEEAKEDKVQNDYVEIDDDVIEGLQSTADQKCATSSLALLKLGSWKQAHREEMQKMAEQSREMQRELKAMCAMVRNEYSTACLQEDFRAGLKELTRKSDDEDADASDTGSTPIPDDFQMDVYCISANDHLKIQGIKPSSDGPPSCFTKAEDTQIPALRAFVHETTAKHRVNFTEAFVNNASDMLDRVKLVAADAKDIPSGRSSRRCKAIFETEMQALEKKVQPIVTEFRRKAQAKVHLSLQPALKSGAGKGNAAAMSTVMSWGSKSRRSKQDRRPEKNGLYWSTYFATVRRDGTYVSASAGEIDMNQELCDPMEKEFSADWQRIMDAAFRGFLNECERQMLALCASVDQALVAGFSGAGMSSDRLSSMVNAASRSCSNSLKASFQAMQTIAANSQRSLNRSLLPMVQNRMKDGFSATVNVPGGPGKFQRMKGAMEQHARGAVHSMFSESTVELLKKVGSLIEQLATMVSASVKVTTRALESVYSVCWDDESDKAALMDPVLQEKVRACRDKCLPDLHRLGETVTGAMQLLGIERDELELDVMGVESWEVQNAKKLKDAMDKGDIIDLMDSDDDDITKPAAIHKPALVSTAKKVKAEPSNPYHQPTPPTNTLGYARMPPVTPYESFSI